LTKLRAINPHISDLNRIQPGDSIDTVAQYMFSHGPHHTMDASTKRALLIHITPAKLEKMDINHWGREQSLLVEQRFGWGKWEKGFEPVIFIVRNFLASIFALPGFEVVEIDWFPFCFSEECPEAFVGLPVNFKHILPYI
jgi:hypothetical protein